MATSDDSVSCRSTMSRLVYVCSYVSLSFGPLSSLHMCPEEQRGAFHPFHFSHLKGTTKFGVKFLPLETKPQHFSSLRLWT